MKTNIQKTTKCTCSRISSSGNLLQSLCTFIFNIQFIISNVQIIIVNVNIIIFNANVIILQYKIQHLLLCKSRTSARHPPEACRGPSQQRPFIVKFIFSSIKSIIFGTNVSIYSLNSIMFSINSHLHCPQPHLKTFALTLVRNPSFKMHNPSFSAPDSIIVRVRTSAPSPLTLPFNRLNHGVFAKEGALPEEAKL